MKIRGTDGMMPVIRNLFALAASREMLPLFDLSEKERELFVMLFWDKKSLDEIAEHLGSSADTVYRMRNKLIFRIFGKLREALYELKSLAAVKEEIKNLKNENKMYQQRFAVLSTSEKEEVGDVDVLKRPVETLKLTVRLSNILEAAEINTVGDLVEWSEARLLQQPFMGQKSINVLKDALAAIGAELKK